MKTLIKLDILKNPGLYNNYEHTIDFESIEVQTAFWDAKVEQTFNNIKVNFVNDNKLKILGNYQALKNASYLRTTLTITINNITTLKNMYYFINNIKLLSSNEENVEQTIELTIEEDVLQTYMFDYEIKDSFVEREHQDRAIKSNGEISRNYNRIKENITTNNLILKSDTTLGNNVLYAIFVFSENVPGAIGFPVVENVGNQMFTSGFYYYVVPFILGSTIAPIMSGADISVDYPAISIQRFLNDFGKADTMVACYILPYFNDEVYLNFEGYEGTRPKFKVNGANWVYKAEGLPGQNIIAAYLQNKSYFKNILCGDYDFTKPEFVTDINSAPILTNESKLFTFDYAKAMLTNNHSDNLEIDLSYIEGIKDIKCDIGLSDNPRMRLYIENYKNDNGNVYSLTDNQIGYNDLKSNAWKNYVNNNRATLNSGLKNSFAKDILKGVVGGAGAGAILGGAQRGIVGATTGLLSAGLNVVSNIIDREELRENLQSTPDNIRSGGNNLDFDYATTGNKYHIYEFELTEEDKKIMFDYFLHYGYKSLEIKIPNIKSRYYFNFIKMIANISGNLNIDLINKIKSIYNNGITIWHYRTTDTFLFNDYSKENVEMSLLN